jgi:hypothetical protein
MGLVDRLGLAETIALLRQELSDAMSEGAGKAVQFAVGGVDLEFQVEVGREGEGGAKVRIWVIEAGGSGKLHSASTQTLRIHLDPVDAVTKTQVIVAETGSPPAAGEGRGGSARPDGPTAATG